MAHELAFTKGKASIAYTKSGGLPWHGLGVPCGDNETPESMGKKAGALYPVEKRDIYHVVGDQHLTIPNRRALVRADTNAVLDIVGDGWEPCQNLTALQFFDEFVR